MAETIAVIAFFCAFVGLLFIPLALLMRVIVTAWFRTFSRTESQPQSGFQEGGKR
tara:strand:- start:2952 stop:3116 length:165 start_codon:yes stop_codon:yes gene_type:complete